MKEVKRISAFQIFLVAFIIVIIACLGLFRATSQVLASAAFLNNTRVNGVDISALTQEQAVDKLVAEYEGQRPNTSVTVRCNGVERTFTSADVGLKSNAREVFTAFLNSKLTVGDGVNALYELRTDGGECDVQWTMDYKSLHSAVAQFAKQFEKASVDATVTFNPNTDERFVFTPSQNGEYLDVKELTDAVWAKFTNADTAPIDAATKTKAPLVTKQTLEESVQLIGTCTTKLDSKNVARTNNIDLISQTVNGVVVAPGETFSVNEASGKRTIEKGYQPARVIINGEYVDEYGGGVCQLSGTLYNAALYADAEIIKRQRHTIASTYLPLGLDAVIDFDSGKDLIFKNATERNMYLEVIRVDDELTVNIYGVRRCDPLEIRIESVTVKTIEPGTPVLIKDPKLPAGETVLESKESKGHQVKVYRKYYDGETLIKSETLSNDYYKERAAVYRMGTKEVEPAPEPEITDESKETTITGPQQPNANMYDPQA